MEFIESEQKCYVKGTAYESGDYEVVKYEWDLRANVYYKETWWAAYKRINYLKGRPFRDYVDPDNTHYKTRKQAEKACCINARELNG